MSPEFWWHVSRASGLMAWGFLSFTMLWGLALSTRVLGRRPGARLLLSTHRWVSGLGVAFTVLHLVALVADSYTHFTLSDLLVPLASIGYLGFAHACGAEDLDRLVDRPPASDPRLTTSRLATLSIGPAIVPTLLIIDATVGGGNSWVTFGLATSLSLLLLARIVGLLRSRDRAADSDAALLGGSLRRTQAALRNLLLRDVDPRSAVS